MKSKHKALLLSMCAVLLVAASVFETIAYLTDTEAVTNTFTVGSVGLSIDEADVKPDGTLDTNDRVPENEYHLLPGHTYIKDPTIYIDADSENCYLFVKVENGIEDIETTAKGKTIVAQMEARGWVVVDGATDIYVLAKGEGEPNFKYTVSKGAEVEVFAEFTIDGDKVVNVPKGETVPKGKLDLTAYAEATVKVTAYAVQADGFDNSLAAWAATFGKASAGDAGSAEPNS